MLTSQTPIIVDADALIALLDSNDAHNERALQVTRRLDEIEAPLLYPSTAIIEAATTLQRKFNKPEMVAQIVEMVASHELLIEPVDEALLGEAIAFFRPHGSKHNTLFDAVVAALARKHQSTVVFSFDAWYEKLGLQLVNTQL